MDQSGILEQGAAIDHHGFNPRANMMHPAVVVLMLGRTSKAS
jgi:hypothetical protein